ncbi:MAG: hypothetical protein Q8R70_08200 [Methanoregula sp.]|nr:hypothetical protein [Methanoregula sp.]
MQASIVALIAVLAGIIIQKMGNSNFFTIIGDAFIMGAFVIAVAAFLLFLKARFMGTGMDELAGYHR